MKKSLYDLAYETVHEDGMPLTENEEREIDALVQFGKRVLENAAQHSASRWAAVSQMTAGENMQHEIIRIIAKLDNGSHSASQLEAVERELLALFNKHAAQHSAHPTYGESAPPMQWTTPEDFTPPVVRFDPSISG